ncbi:MAG: HAD family phosphatase [Lachnospiraceae bacterium]|nr:HAD family phosphatase [Lachnospiraceae bacterium]
MEKKLQNKEKAVIFDMDGVLFDTEKLCRETWNKIAKEHNLDNIDEVLTACTGSNRQDTILYMKKVYGEDFDALAFMEICSQINIKKMQEEGIPIKKGAKEILDYLKEENYKVGLASSTRKCRVLENLKNSGFKDYFQVVIGGDMIEHSKPSPDIYLLACKELGVNPAETFAIEDSPNGIRSAYNAGMKAIMVPDLLPPTEEILSMTITCKNDLFEVIEYFKGDDICRK